MTEKKPEPDPIAELLRERWAETENRERTLAYHEENLEAIRFYPASASAHHCYPGGYYDHVLEVLNNTLTMFPLVVLDIGKFTLSDALEAAYWHDVDKACSLEPNKSSWFELDDEPPTEKQREYAIGLGITIDQYESKTSISTKIDAAVAGREIDPREIAYFRYRKDRLPIDESAMVELLASRVGVFFSLPVLSAICTHHSRSFPTKYYKPTPLGILLHAADLISAECQNGKSLGL